MSNFLKETYDGYLRTRRTRFSGIFDLEFDEFTGMRSKVISYVNFLVFLGMMLNFGMLFVFPIDGVSFFLRPALYTTVIMVFVLIYAVRTKNTGMSLFLTLFTALMLLMASLALNATPRHTLWVLLIVFLAFLAQGAKKGFLWVITTSIIIGSLLYLSNSGYIVTDFDPKILAALFLIAMTTSLAFLVHDITLQQYFDLFSVSNAKLAEENARRFALVNALADGIITTDTNGRVTYLNDKASELMGVQSLDQIEGVVGANIVDCITLLDMDNQVVANKDRPENHVLKTGTLINTESSPISYRMQRPDGTNFPIETAVSPVRAGNRNFGMVQIFRDVSWQHEINQAKNEFVSLASHQLRTPLASIKWNCEMLEWPENFDSLTDTQKELFAQVKKSALGMSELVSALLDVSRMELGTLEFSIEKIDIASIAAEALESAQAQASEKSDVELTSKLAKEPMIISADKRFTRMIIDNLLSNAIKYTQEGTVHLEAKRVLASEMTDDHITRDGVLIEVTDSGYGIPEKQQSQIFSKMFRADNVRTTNVGGTGLGLYLVHTTINKMGGTVWFESKENVGTTFYVYFPETH